MAAWPTTPAWTNLPDIVAEQVTKTTGITDSMFNLLMQNVLYNYQHLSAADVRTGTVTVNQVSPSTSANVTCSERVVEGFTYLDWVFDIPQGVQGIQGLSVWIKYSAAADGTDFTVDWSTGQNYIGVAVGATAPVDKTGYTWALFKGEQGIQGVDGNGSYKSLVILPTSGSVAIALSNIDVPSGHTVKVKDLLYDANGTISTITGVGDALATCTFFRIIKDLRNLAIGSDGFSFDVTYNDGTTGNIPINTDNAIPVDEGTLKRTYQGACTTAAATATKIVTPDSAFIFEDGALIHVRFTFGNTVAAPTLSFDGGVTSYPIYNNFNNYAVTATGGWPSATVVQFHVDGTHSRFIMDGCMLSSDSQIFYGRKSFDKIPEVPTTEPTYGYQVPSYQNTRQNNPFRLVLEGSIPAGGSRVLNDYLQASRPMMIQIYGGSVAGSFGQAHFIFGTDTGIAYVEQLNSTTFNRAATSSPTGALFYSGITQFIAASGSGDDLLNVKRVCAAGFINIYYDRIVYDPDGINIKYRRTFSAVQRCNNDDFYETLQRIRVDTVISGTTPELKLVNDNASYSLNFRLFAADLIQNWEVLG